MSIYQLQRKQNPYWAPLLCPQKNDWWPDYLVRKARLYSIENHDWAPIFHLLKKPSIGRQHFAHKDIIDWLPDSPARNITIGCQNFPHRKSRLGANISSTLKTSIGRQHLAHQDIIDWLPDSPTRNLTIGYRTFPLGKLWLAREFLLKKIPIPPLKDHWKVFFLFEDLQKVFQFFVEIF